MRVLICTPVHNTLSQRSFHELVERGHTVVVLTATANSDVEIAIACHQPQLIITIFHKSPLPVHLQRRFPVLNVRTDNHTSRGATSLSGLIDEDWQNLRIDMTSALPGTHDRKVTAESRLIYRHKVRASSNHSCHRHHAAQAVLHKILETVEALETQYSLPEWLSEALFPNNSILKGRLHRMLN